MENVFGGGCYCGGVFCVFLLLLIYFYFLFLHFVTMGISPVGNSGSFSPQGKPAAAESRYPTLTIN